MLQLSSLFIWQHNVSSVPVKGDKGDAVLAVYFNRVGIPRPSYTSTEGFSYEGE